jgi:uncharacterized membrane protein YciS (DUF1049 family)
MRNFEIVAAVIGVFFVTGIAVGMLLVVALPVLSVSVRHRRNRRRYRKDGNWQKLTPRDDQAKPPWYER